jgi:S1-C subfamily serine protease
LKLFSRALGLGIAAVAWTSGCTLAPRETNKPLVADDDPVFESRFRGINPTDIDLTDFWTDGAATPHDEPIPIHHRTFSKIAASASGGTVNLYTRVLHAREARIGLVPGDMLPIRIPILSAVLDYIPFQVPIPYKSHGFSLGSGFLINEAGFILTNAHVVLNATDIRVVRSGSPDEYPAKIIGIDLLSDTALIRIEPQPDMTILPLGSSTALEVGEMVVAVGNPFGLNHTVTSGLVSAKQRIVGEGAELVDYLQTDSAINPGSSGGPLLNLYGEVVGINTAIVSDAQNIGFAIPIDTVKRVMPLLIAGRSERGWFGASARPLEPGEAKQLGESNPNAVVIDKVVPDGPAAIAGVIDGDLVRRVEGIEVPNFVAFRRELIGMLPGQKVSMTLSRAGAPIEIESTLATRP